MGPVLGEFDPVVGPMRGMLGVVRIRGWLVIVMSEGVLIVIIHLARLLVGVVKNGVVVVFRLLVVDLMVEMLVVDSGI